MYKSDIKRLEEEIKRLEYDKEQCRRDLDSQIDKLKADLKGKEERNRELTITNSELSYNVQMMHDDCKAKVTTCEDQLQMCRVYQLQLCQDIVKQLVLDVSNDKELLIELTRCQTKASYVTSDLGVCKDDYKVCSDKLDNYKHERCMGFRV